MSAPCELLRWDSEFFGFPVARVNSRVMRPEDVGPISQWCADADVRLLYFLADDGVTSWASAAGAGFALVDVRSTLAVDLARIAGPQSPPGNGIGLREADVSDLEHLLPIAASAHVESRFFVDSRVPRDKAQELFRTWLSRSVSHELADVVFVAEHEGRAVSYISATLSDGAGSIGLVGVGEVARGRGVGAAMVHKALDWLGGRGAREVSVVTQGRNLAAQRLYTRCGFLPVSLQFWFHRWFR